MREKQQKFRRLVKVGVASVTGTRAGTRAGTGTRVKTVAVSVAAAVSVVSWLTVSAVPAFAGPASGQAVQAGPDLMISGQPVAMASDPTTHTFWIAASNFGEANDNVVSITEGAKPAIKSFNVASGVDAIAVDSGLGLVWAIGNGSSTSHDVTFIKESSGVLTSGSVSVSANLTGIAVDPSTKKVLLLDQNGDVLTVDENHPSGAPTSLVHGALTSAAAIAVDPGTAKIWVVDAGGNAVRQFSETTGTQIGGPIAVGANPSSIAIDPTAKTVWVGNSNSTVSEFGESSTGTVHTIKVATSPDSITVDPKTGVAWVGSVDGSVFGITEKTSPPSSIGSVTPAPEAIDGIAADPGNGQVWAVDNVPAQGTFNNVFPLLPTAPKFTSAASTWLATNNPAQRSFGVTTTAFPPATFTLTGAPSFLSIGKQTGVVSGKLTTKSKLGAFKVSISATNGIGSAAHQTLTVHIGSDPALTATSGTFAIGVKNSQQIKVTGTPAPAFTGLSLPKGLTLSKSGVLSGTLPKGTKSPVTFGIELNNQVTAAFRSPVVALFHLKLAPGKAPKLTSRASVSFKHGKHSTFTIKSTGFPSPALKLTGKLPKGLTFKAGAPGTGTISGTPATTTKGHSFKIKITASNGVGKSASQTLTIKVT
jgi:hypothetical protein